MSTARSRVAVRREQEDMEIRLAGACTRIEEQFGGDSDVWRAVHAAFCVPSPVPPRKKNFKTQPLRPHYTDYQRGVRNERAALLQMLRKLKQLMSALVLEALGNCDLQLAATYQERCDTLSAVIAGRPKSELAEFPNA